MTSSPSQPSTPASDLPIDASPASETVEDGIRHDVELAPETAPAPVAPAVDNPAGQANAESEGSTAEVADAKGPSAWLFFVPLIIGAVLSAFAGAPTTWKDHAPGELVAPVALAAAYFLTLAAWKDEMKGADYLKSTQRFFSLVTSAFLLGATVTAAVVEAAAQGWNVPLVLLGAVFGVPALLLLAPLFDKMMGGKKTDD